MYVKYEKLRTHVLHKCPSKVPRRRLLARTRFPHRTRELVRYVLLGGSLWIKGPFAIRLRHGAWAFFLRPKTRLPISDRRHWDIPMKFKLTQKIGRRMAGLFSLSVVFLITSGAVAKTSLHDIYQVAQAINDSAKDSQQIIEDLSDETDSLYNTYRGVLKNIESLKIYNANLDRQIRDQERKMARIRKSTQDVSKVQSQITPLMFRMVEVLEQYIDNDLPFLMEERRHRVENLRLLMDNSSVSESERFNQVIRAYQIESEYGRTMEYYTAEIEVDGTTQIVDVLKVGRIALVYQTSDGSESGWWSPTSRRWEKLGNKYSGSIRNGLKMARKQLTAGLFAVPVVAPEGN